MGDVSVFAGDSEVGARVLIGDFGALTPSVGFVVVMKEVSVVCLCAVGLGGAARDAMNVCTRRESGNAKSSVFGSHIRRGPYALLSTPKAQVTSSMYACIR